MRPFGDDDGVEQEVHSSTLRGPSFVRGALSPEPRRRAARPDNGSDQPSGSRMHLSSSLAAISRASAAVFDTIELMTSPPVASR